MRKKYFRSLGAIMIAASLMACNQSVNTNVVVADEASETPSPEVIDETHADTDITENDSDDDSVEEVIKDFISSIHTPQGYEDVFEASWVKAHCSHDLQQRLIDEYEFDSEPGEVNYASWIIGGWEEGMDVESRLDDVVTSGNEHYTAIFSTKEEGFVGKRKIRYHVILEDDTPIILDVEKISDFSEE